MKESQNNPLNYNKALVMGKFMPIHNGHVALVKHALSLSQSVMIAIVAKADEPIPIEIRRQWFEAIFPQEIASCRLIVTCFHHELPHDGTFKSDHVLAWCEEISSRYHGVDVFVSSETYGDTLANYMGIQHVIFDLERSEIAVSGSAIRENPQEYKAYLPDVVAKYYGLE